MAVKKSVAGWAIDRVRCAPGIVTLKDPDRDPGDRHNGTPESRVGLRGVKRCEAHPVEDGDNQSDESQSLPFHDLSVPAAEAADY